MLNGYQQSGLIQWVRMGNQHLFGYRKSGLYYRQQQHCKCNLFAMQRRGMVCRRHGNVVQWMPRPNIWLDSQFWRGLERGDTMQPDKKCWRKLQRGCTAPECNQHNGMGCVNNLNRIAGKGWIHCQRPDMYRMFGRHIQCGLSLIHI